MSDKEHENMNVKLYERFCVDGDRLRLLPLPCDTICIMAQWDQAEKASLPSGRPVRDCTAEKRQICTQRLRRSDQHHLLYWYPAKAQTELGLLTMGFLLSVTLAALPL